MMWKAIRSRLLLLARTLVLVYVRTVTRLTLLPLFSLRTLLTPFLTLFLGLFFALFLALLVVLARLVLLEILGL